MDSIRVVVTSENSLWSKSPWEIRRSQNETIGQGEKLAGYLFDGLISHRAINHPDRTAAVKFANISWPER